MRRRRRIHVLVAATLSVATSAAAPANAGAGTSLGPSTIDLPAGFQPEGIAIGALPYAYFGSRATGAIYRANLLTGRGKVINAGPGTPSLGMKVDARGRLFVAGGSGGDGRVVDTRTGRLLASYRFTDRPSFVNDVVLTPDAAWFTDSTNPVLYRVPLGRHGALPAPHGVVPVPLSGDIVYGSGINANGIARTPDGRALLIVQSSTGLLFRVDPATGVTRAVDLGAELLPNGDGLLLDGRTLYVVQNRLNTLAVLRLDRSGDSGRVVGRITDTGFDVPTTVAAYGRRLYLPNARFTTTPTPATPYTAVAVPRP
ncbi:SMP-30/gluconolactonase/LRE family protein [Plantactinospora sp. S1510]|uniref:SMP-30/gluconolactonase/LRE family protein n=1 Tax=Plantactinospora alkalitolerans TaxID=2789879 RepID=A0ABS0H346_9ACTN|nr:SMP-30/gluconolactonase/LRE family protein [Plantactinospora alkalitolerans]MBF9132564.1 SMP-30/gluconolactonase/LRE family protein [Plantactinospora alkalitolerans]